MVNDNLEGIELQNEKILRDSDVILNDYFTMSNE